MLYTYKLAFYKGRKSNSHSHFMDNLICFATRSEYSHVELLLNDSGYSVSSSPRDGGVRFTNIIYDQAQWDFVDIELRLSPEGVRSWFLPNVGMKYDYWGAIGTVLKFIPEDYDKWFCSEIISMLIIHYGILQLPETPKRMSPAKLYKAVTTS